MKVVKKLVLTALLAATGLAANAVAKASDANAMIKNKLAPIGIVVDSVEDSPIKGLKQVLTNHGVFYVSENGQFLMRGVAYDLDNGMDNITENALRKVRKKGVEQYKDSMIVFPAENEKHVVTVFTDVTCGYCQKLHREMKDYNDLGITVQYLAFPRGGLSGKTFDLAQDVWCADDQKEAMTSLKANNNNEVDTKACSVPIAEHYALGQSIGVTGTPAIVLSDGSFIGGYKPAQALLRDLP
ncbi:MAG: bifunctional protein-disulfide isomerase/oxidoreductase DsbC [Gammaproteobacteria bacterium]|nr:bifunctional protein-disulfide isomerase/oxidoreductase DsbC [Gammaproteobacteria bacterium]